MRLIPGHVSEVHVWAVWQGPLHGWIDWGWVVYRSVREGMKYRQELVLGGPTTDEDIILKFLRGVKEVQNGS